MLAVEQLLTERRWHQITTDDVAALAKVGKGTLYKYFRDKDDLFFQTAVAGFDELCALIRVSARIEAPFERQLETVCERTGAFFAHRRQVFRMMQTEDGGQGWCRPEMKDVWNRKRQMMLNVLAEVMQRGQQEGAIRRDVPAAVLATFFLGMVRTRARDLADAPEPQRSNRLIVDLFLHGVAAGASSGRGAASSPRLVSQL